jgi:hypothetical protein
MPVCYASFSICSLSQRDGLGASLRVASIGLFDNLPLKWASLNHRAAVEADGA